MQKMQYFNNAFRLKKSPKQNSAKIILSFQLTRKIDSSIEDSSDANPEARQEKKIHFSEDIRKLHLPLFTSILSLKRIFLA